MHPILFKWHGFAIYSYGFFVALSVLIVWGLASAREKKFHEEPGAATDLLFVMFVFGVIGARAFFVLQHLEDYRGHAWRALSIQEGGLVWYGGFMTAAAAGIFYARLRRWPLLFWCDFFAPILPLAHAIGRIGCFFNGCCFGRVTDFGGVYFPDDPEPRFPVQLYESVLLFALSGFLFYRLSKRPKEGEVFMGYLVGYSLIRFFLEFLRGDQMRVHFLTLPQWMSLFLFAGGIFLLLAIKKKGQSHGKL